MEHSHLLNFPSFQLECLNILTCRHLNLHLHCLHDHLKPSFGQHQRAHCKHQDAHVMLKGYVKLTIAAFMILMD